MRYIGPHVSTEGGVQNAPLNAQKNQANAFALFTRSPRSWNAPELSFESAAAFKANLKTAGIEPSMVLPHDNYLVNLASPKKELAEKSFETILDECRRVETLGLEMLNFHPGSRGDSDLKPALQRIGNYAKTVLQETSSVSLIIEATAGQGAHTGRSFEDLAAIIEYAGMPERMGVCLDTCHIFAAGYDLRTAEAYTETMRQFDRLLGAKMLRGMHLNDSMKGFGSHIDRHSPLGQGEIGIEAFKLIINDSHSADIPLILETPQPDIWPQEIALLRSFEN